MDAKAPHPTTPDRTAAGDLGGAAPAATTSRPGSAARAPARLYRAVAIAEMVTWTPLILGFLATRVLDQGPWPLRLGGAVHGFVYLAYTLVTVIVAVDQRWRVGQLALGLASAVVPYATWPFERWAERRGLLGRVWRLATERPRGLVERAVAHAVAHPVAAVVVGALGVTIVFTGLLMAGPPTQWFDR